MNHQASMDSLKAHEIPGRVTIFSGKGGLPAVKVLAADAEAEIYQNGAHIALYQAKGCDPLLFLSGRSHFTPGQPIRGGVPIIFPWFGARDGHPAHGTARLSQWDLTESIELPDGSIRVSFHLPDSQPLAVDFTVIVGSSLVMELAVSNHGENDATFETCLHTYFEVGDIHQVEVVGLKGATYIDSLTGETHVDPDDILRFTSETDRLYQNTDSTVEILDPTMKRRITVAKSGSLSTVVWNPWIAKSQRMPDFGDDEWPRMLCVESGNVKADAITLEPGGRSQLKVELASSPLA
jgi:D-hexose-6-phosphate mutarotase